MFSRLFAFMTRPLHLLTIELSFSPLQVIVRLLLPLGLLIATYKLLVFLVQRVILRPIRAKPETKEKVLRYSRLGLRITFLVLLFLLVSAFFETEIQRYVADFLGILSRPLFTAGTTSVSIVTLLLVIPSFYLASWFARLSRRFFDASVLNRIAMQESTRLFVSNLVRYGVMMIVILVCLSIVGIDLSSLAVLFGVLGIGVGFGLQTTVANFFSGLILLFERPIQEGDRISMEGVEGDVVQIRLRSTIINTLTNETIFVPNSLLVDRKIHNYSYRDKRIIIINRVQVAYETDVDQALQVLKQVAVDSDYILPLPEPVARAAEFQDSGILMELWSWISDPRMKRQALAGINHDIWVRFREHGIRIPFPQLDLHLPDGTTPPPTSG